MQPDAVREKCLSVESDKINVLLFGDSHAAMFAGGIRQNFEDVKLLQITSGWCLPTNPDYRPHKGAEHVCPEIHALFWEAIDGGEIDVVVVSARWTLVPGVETEIDALGSLADRLEKSRVGLYVIGPAPELTERNPDLIARSLNQHSLRKNQYSSLNPLSFEVDRLFLKASRTSSWKYFSAVDALCADGDPKNCDFLIQGKFPHSHDEAHFSHWASRQVVASLRDDQGLEFPALD